MKPAELQVTRRPKKMRTVVRFCNFCGQEFMARAPHATRCSPSCQNKAWRAWTMLAGTHGYVQGKFQRLHQQ